MANKAVRLLIDNDIIISIMKYYLVASVALLLGAYLFVAKGRSFENGRGDYVVIFHGIGRSSWHMKPLAKYLVEQGYDVINLDYPSTDYPLEKLVEIVHENLASKLTENKTVHLIGYSMGGLLTRALLCKYPPKHLGRVLLLASPNKGSEVADFFQNNWLYQKVYGPAGQQLITDQSKLKNLFGKIDDYELGVIAGCRSIDPISLAIIGGKDDGKVSIESTKLAGMKDHIVVSATHAFFPSNKKVHQQTAYFLKKGKFDHAQNK